jgi:hypothetical protein
MGRKVKKEVYRKCTVIKFELLMNYLTDAAASYTLHSFMLKKNKFLTTTYRII